TAAPQASSSAKTVYTMRDVLMRRLSEGVSRPESEYERALIISARRRPGLRALRAGLADPLAQGRRLGVGRARGQQGVELGQGLGEPVAVRQEHAEHEARVRVVGFQAQRAARLDLRRVVALELEQAVGAPRGVALREHDREGVGLQAVGAIGVVDRL